MPCPSTMMKQIQEMEELSKNDIMKKAFTYTFLAKGWLKEKKKKMTNVLKKVVELQRSKVSLKQPIGIIFP